MHEKIYPELGERTAHTTTEFTLTPISEGERNILKLALDTLEQGFMGMRVSKEAFDALQALKFRVEFAAPETRHWPA